MRRSKPKKLKTRDASQPSAKPNGGSLTEGRRVLAIEARAVQALHDLYRDIPRRLPVDSVRLDRLSYADGEQTEGIGSVRFQLSFAINAAPQRP